MTVPIEPYGVVAEFTGPDALVAALTAANEAGYSRLDAFAPFPMGEAAEALRAGAFPVQRIAWSAAAVGAAIQFGAQYWMNAVDYPLNVGGRPLNSWPAFLPSTLIVAILWAGAATLISLFIRLRLPRLDHPLFAVPGFERASQDRFFLLIRGDDPLFELEPASLFLRTLEPSAVRAVSQCD